MSAQTELADHLIARIVACLPDAGADGPEQVGVVAIRLLHRLPHEPSSFGFAWDRPTLAVSASEPHSLRQVSDRYNVGTWAVRQDFDDERSDELWIAALREAGIEPPPAGDEDADAIDVIDNMSEMQARFIRDLTLRMHRDGTLRDVIGRDVLILCITPSDNDPWTQLTLDANPSELYGDFAVYHEHEGVHGETF